MEILQEPLDHYELEKLLATINEESKTRKSRRYVAGFVLSLIFLMAALSAFFSIAMHWNISFIFNPAFYFGGIFAMAAISQKQKEATKALAKYSDVRCIPAFADVLECKDKKLEMIAEEKLIQLLPLIKASDAPLLNENQRKNLNSAIEKRGSTVACAIMKAYEQVGDGSAIPHVERVKKETNEILRKQAAERCLPFLVQRAETDKLRQTLLRAADGNTQTSASNMLLRPASSTTTEMQSETLLRPIQTEDDAHVTASGTAHRTEYADNRCAAIEEQRIELGAGQSD